MVGQTYLRYVVGPQGGAVASPAALTLQARRFPPRHRQGSSEAVLFVPSLEAVRVYAAGRGDLLHTLIPAEVAMPVEVTALHVLPPSLAERRGRGEGAETGETWRLLVGYNNGFVASFGCGPTNNYGRPVCHFYALGHRVDTHVLALAMEETQTTMCTAGQDTDITVWDGVSQEAVYRLRGHRGGVVALHFVPTRSHLLLSGAADGQIRVWHLGLRHCVQTIVASDAQVTSLAMDAAGRRLYCGTREALLRVYNTEALLTSAETAEEAEKEGGGMVAGLLGKGPRLAWDESDAVVAHGTIPRRYHKAPTSLSFSADGHFLLAGTSKTVEVFHLGTVEEVRRRVARKRQRRRAGTQGAAPEEVEEAEEEAKKEATTTTTTTTAVETPLPGAPTAAEEVTLLRTYFLADKVRAACFIPSPETTRGAAASLHLAVMHSHNNLQTFSTAVSTSDRSGAATLTLDDLTPRHSWEHRGHQSDIRALAFVETDTALLSMSREAVRLWSVSIQADRLESDHLDHHDFYDAAEANVARVDFRGSLQCVGVVAVEEAVTMAALSARLCAVGQADGALLLLDVPASLVLLREGAAHTGGVSHVSRRPDASGFLSLGVDRRLVLWTVGWMEDQTVTLLPASEVELAETGLFATFSPDGRLLAVGLQNHQIQLFFGDSLKPYLTLFGHKLPPTAVAFSSDGTLVASVGMDKSLRFWGTDFGDCHRAIHAHDDYVTQVVMIPDTHYALTVSADGSLKQWDGDTWTMVQLFRQHQRGVWAVAVTQNGTCIATAGTDKCLRCFLRTSDIVFPQEEEERRAQAAMDEEAAQRAARQRLDQTEVEVGVAGQPTPATAEAAERLMEALDIVSVERQRRHNPADAGPPHPLLARCTEWEFLWSTLERIRPSELRHALGALTRTHVDALLSGLEAMVRAGVVGDYELASKVLLALVGPGGGAVAGRSGDGSEVQTARRLEALRRGISRGLDESVGRMDYNVAGLQMTRQHLEDTSRVRFFDVSKIQGYKKRYHSRALPAAPS